MSALADLRLIIFTGKTLLPRSDCPHAALLRDGLARRGQFSYDVEYRVTQRGRNVGDTWCSSRTLHIQTAHVYALPIADLLNEAAAASEIANRHGDFIGLKTQFGRDSIAIESTLRDVSIELPPLAIQELQQLRVQGLK